MILLQANELARRFAGETLYENVSFSIQTRDRIALVGRNGTGKSTLIKQILGQEPLSSGTISKNRGVKIGYLEQHVSINSQHSIWEEMLSTFQDTLTLRKEAEQAALTLSHLSDQIDSPAYTEALEKYDRIQEDLTNRNAYAIESDIRTILHGFRFFENDYNRPVSSLSGGEKTRLALAQILLMDYDLLILDEPTNHLDMEMLRWLEQYLTTYKGALLIVSHDRYFLDKVATQVIEIRNHQAHLYKGNYSFYIQEKMLRMEQEWREYQKQQDTIAKMEDFVQRNIARASTTKRAQSRRKQLEKMIRLDKPQQDEKAPHIQFSIKKESGNQVLEIQNLAIGYPPQAIAEGINFDLQRQEAIAIVGPNGIGKSTLLKTLIGELPAIQGNVSLGTGVSIGYYSQQINLLDDDLTVLETLWQAHDTTDEWIIRSILGSFLFTGDTVEKKVKMLSGGERARLTLALLATNHDNTLILDEPTNHLDIDSKEVLENALINFDGTLLFVSHDRYFINRLATKIIEITPEGATLYLGDYDYYLTKKEEMSTLTDVKMDQTNTHKSPKGLDFAESKRIKQEIRKLTNTVEKLNQDLENLSQEIDSLHLILEEASLTNDQETLQHTHSQLIQLQEKEALLLEAWESASLELENFQASLDVSI